MNQYPPPFPQAPIPHSPQMTPHHQRIAKVSAVWLLVLGVCLLPIGTLALINATNVFMGMLWTAIMVIGAVALVGAVVIKAVTDVR